MYTLRRRLLAIPNNYVNPAMRQRARGLVAMIWAAIAVIVLLIAVRAMLVLLNVDSTLVIAPLELVVGLLLLLGAYGLIQRGRLDAAIWLFLGSMLVPFVLATAIAVDPAAPAILILPLVAAGVLLNRRSIVPILVIFAITLILRAVNQGGTTDAISYVPAQNALPELLNYGIVFGLSAVFLLVFSGSLEQIVAVSFGDLEQLRAIGKFSGRLEDNTDEMTIYARLLEIVERDLGFDLAQIYLRDAEGAYTRRLRLGLTQVEMGTRIVLRGGDIAVIDEAILRREPIIVTTRDDLSRSEHLVPPARQSVTLALVYGDQVFAVLDVQTEHRDMFTENVVEGLRYLAVQAGRELVHARRFEELLRSVRDQEGIIDRFLSQMSELQRRSESAAGVGWARYLDGRGQEGFGFDYGAGTIAPASDLPETIRQAVARGDIYTEQRGDNQIVNVPIILRDQRLGALTFTVPAERAVDERQIEMLRTVVNRLGVALENNRLFEQTQAQAQRERKASEIGSTLLSETDIETVLELAAENFNEALGAVHTRVYLEPGVLSGEAL